MADKIKMEVAIMDSMTSNFRNMGGNLDEIIRNLNKVLVSLEFSYTSATSLVMQENISKALDAGKQIVDGLYKLSSKLNTAKTAIVNADKSSAKNLAVVTRGSLYRGDSPAEKAAKLKKYKSINIKTSKKQEEDGVAKVFDTILYNFLQKHFPFINWNDTTPPTHYIPIIGKDIGTIPSTGDLTNYIVSTLASSIPGTIIGNMGKISKEGSTGYINEKGTISLYPKNSTATYAPYTSQAKTAAGVAKTFTLVTMGFDVGNTWTAWDGNSLMKRLEKSVIQIVGNGVAYGGGKVSEVVAGFGMANIWNGSGVPIIGGAAAIDVGVAKTVNDAEKTVCGWLHIK